MGDTQSCLFGLWLLLDRSACGQRRSAVHKSTGPSFRVSRPLEATVIDVDEAQVDVGIAHLPFTGWASADADRLADQHLADEDQLAVPLDLAVRAHPADLAVLAIHRLLQLAWIAPRRWPGERSGIVEGERFVRPFAVVDPAESNQTRLLLGHAPPPGPCRVGPERPRPPPL